MNDLEKATMVHVTDGEITRTFLYERNDYVRGLENLALAIQLFHKGSPWMPPDTDEWVRLVGCDKDVTSKSLCDMARRVLKLKK